MKNSTISTQAQISKRINQLNSLIVKFARVRSLIRKWAFELTILEGRLEALKAVAVVEKPKQLTIWDVEPMLEIIHRKSYEYKEQIKAMGCKWNPSKKAWIAPNESVWNQVAQMLEDADDIRCSAIGRQGYSEMTAEAVDEFFADKTEAPQQLQTISFTPTMNDAIKLLGEEQVRRYWDKRIPVEASKILASGEANENEIFDRLSYEGMKGKSVDMLIDLVNHFRKN